MEYKIDKKFTFGNTEADPTDKKRKKIPKAKERPESSKRNLKSKNYKFNRPNTRQRAKELLSFRILDAAETPNDNSFDTINSIKDEKIGS